MPIYEYACRSCGEQFEVIHTRRDPPAPTCPACGRGESLTRLLSAHHVGPATAAPAPEAPATCGRCGREGPGCA